MNDRDILYQQFIKLGDMMGDGLHLEKDGRWIAREYKRISKNTIPRNVPQKRHSIARHGNCRVV